MGLGLEYSIFTGKFKGEVIWAEINAVSNNNNNNNKETNFWL